MNNKELIESGMDIMESFLIAISEAGGCITSFSKEGLKQMSAYDLISLLSTNNIKFIYGGQK